MKYDEARALVGVCMGQGGREGGRCRIQDINERSVHGGRIEVSGRARELYVCMYVCVQSGVGSNKETAINTKTKTEQVKDGGGDDGGTVH